LLRILTPAMALFLLAGCSLLPSEPEVMVAEPELVASNLQIELVEVSQTMVLVRLSEQQSWEQTTTIGEQTTNEQSETTVPFNDSFQVAGSYWNNRYCITEEIIPLQIQPLENGHYMLQFHTGVRDLQRLQLYFSDSAGKTLGELCVNCQTDLRCN